jgi:hypothetical protein
MKHKEIIDTGYWYPLSRISTITGSEKHQSFFIKRFMERLMDHLSGCSTARLWYLSFQKKNIP